MGPLLKDLRIVSEGLEEIWGRRCGPRGLGRRNHVKNTRKTTLDPPMEGCGAGQRGPRPCGP
eukprot:498157-Pyramimonas_sp.AAC.1